VQAFYRKKYRKMILNENDVAPNPEIAQYSKYNSVCGASYIAPCIQGVKICIENFFRKISVSVKSQVKNPRNQKLVQKSLIFF